MALIRSQEQTFPLASNYISYYFAPVFRLILSLLTRIFLPYLRGLCSSELGLLFFPGNKYIFASIWVIGAQPAT